MSDRMNGMERTDDTLEHAIQQQINLGENDPFEIAAKIERARGREWLVSQLDPYATDIVAQFARARLSALRNNSLLQLADEQRTNSPRRLNTQNKLILTSKWVPAHGEFVGGHVRIGDLTAQDNEACAQHYRMLAGACIIRAEWHEHLADRLKARRLTRVKELIRVEELPELPHVPEFLELTA